MSEKFVVVDAFDYFPQASTAKAMLENRGIPVVLTDVEMTNVNWFWHGFVGGIKVVVPETQAEAARAILKEMRRVARESESSDDDVPLDATCPSCGAPLPATGTACAKCGWSFEGEEVKDYANGPVPTSLLSFVYLPLGSDRFALPIGRIVPYAAWCARNGVEITGWEIWERGLPGHTRISSGEGNVDALRAAVEKAATGDASKLLVCPQTRPLEAPHNAD